MKTWIYFLAFVLAIGCSNKYESIVDLSPAPGLSFSRDTISIRERDYTNVLFSNNGRLTIYCSDPTHQLNLMRDDTSSSVHVMYRGEDIVPGKSLPVTDSLQVFITSDKPGIFDLGFYLTNRLGKTTKKNAQVKVFANQPATASFIYGREAETLQQSWPYYFDASLSNKPDGVIVFYHYLMDSQAVDSQDPVIHWTFHAKGEHTIGLYVTDDLGQHSATVTKKILIP